MTLKQVMDIIYTYFPKNLSFNDPNYKTSLEYKRMLKLREIQLLDFSKKENVWEKLTDTFQEYCVIDWTDLKSNNCFEYRILLHKNQPILDDDTGLMKVLNGKRYDLFLFISIFEKLFYVFINETSLNCNTDQWEFNEVLNQTEEQKIIINKLKNILIINGYNEISKEIANYIIDDVETEFLEHGNVKVFNCLFTDLVSIN